MNYGAIALMWRGGCIIRSVFLGNIKDAYKANPNLENLLLDDFFKVIFFFLSIRTCEIIYIVIPFQLIKTILGRYS